MKKILSLRISQGTQIFTVVNRFESIGAEENLGFVDWFIYIRI